MYRLTQVELFINERESRIIAQGRTMLTVSLRRWTRMVGKHSGRYFRLLMTITAYPLATSALSSCQSMMLPQSSLNQTPRPFGADRQRMESPQSLFGTRGRTEAPWLEQTDGTFAGPNASRSADSSDQTPWLSGPAQANRPTYFKQVAPSAWRCKVPADQLFPLVARHLSGSYILAQTDAGSRTIVTEWDKFFIGGRLFRNKMSVSLFPVSPLETELLIMNKLEYFQQNSERQAFGESDWIPTQDVTNERAQLIESLSQLLHALNLASATHNLSR